MNYIWVIIIVGLCLFGYDFYSTSIMSKNIKRVYSSIVFLVCLLLAYPFACVLFNLGSLLIIICANIQLIY